MKCDVCGGKLKPLEPGFDVCNRCRTIWLVEYPPSK